MILPRLCALFNRMRPLFVCLWIMGLHLMENGVALAKDNRCKQKKSEYGIALLGSSSSTILAADFWACLELCNQDEKCYSANFETIKLVCELNSQTRVTRFNQMTQKPMSIYMESTVRNLESPPYKSVGCFEMKGDGAKYMQPMIFNFRGKKDVYDLWNKLDAVVDDCAKKVREDSLQKKQFGLKYYGECWAGNNAEETYKLMTKSDKCFEGRLGIEGTIYMYEFN